MSTSTVLDTVGTGLSIAGILAGGWLGFGIIMAGEFLSSKAARRRLERAGEDEVSAATFGSPEAPLPVVYGEAEVGGRIVDIRALPRAAALRPKDGLQRVTQQLAVVVAWGVGSEDGSGVEAIERTYVNDGLVSVNGSAVRAGLTGPPLPDFADEVNEFFDYLYYDEYLGTDTQQTFYTPSAPVPPNPVAGEPGTSQEDRDAWDAIWGADSRLRGVAYSVFVFWWRDEGVYEGGIPTEFKAKIRGNKVFDPRTNTTEWSDNPALCLADYLTSKRYGAGIDYSEIDESSLIANANLQDEIVGDYTRPDVEGTIDIRRGIVGGAVDTSATLEANISDIAATGRIALVYESGRFKLSTRTIETPVDFEINESNIIGDIQFTRSGVRDVPTSVSVKFLDRFNRWAPTQISFPPENIDNPFIDAAGGWENNLHVDVRLCPDEGTAFDIAQVLFAEAQLDQGVTVTCNESALQLSVGDIVPVSHETMGWDGKLFRVFGMGLSPMGDVQVILRDYDDTAYDLDPTTTVPRNPGSDLPNPFDIGPPTEFALISDENTALQTQDGQFLPRILATWLDDPSIFLSVNEVEYAEYDDEDLDPSWDPEDWEWQELPPVPPGRLQKLIGPVTDGQEYVVRIRSRTRLGAVSDWAYETVEASTQPGADGDSGLAPQIIAEVSYDVDGNGDDIAIVVAEIFDPYQRQIATDPVIYFLRPGPVGDIPAPTTPDWDVATLETSGPNEGKYVWQVPLSEKHFSFLGIAVRWEDFSQNQFIVQKNLYLDIGDDANIVFITVSYDGQVATINVKGDADTQGLFAQESEDGVGNWGSVVDPTPTFTGDQFSSTRRGEFSVLTRTDRKRFFRVRGINASSEFGEWEEFAVNRYEDPGDADIGPVQIRSMFGDAAQGGSTSFFDRSLNIIFRADPEVDSIRFQNNRVTAGTPDLDSSYLADRSEWTPLSGNLFSWVVTDNSGDPIDFPDSYDSDIAITLVAYDNATGTEPSIGSDQDIFPQGSWYGGEFGVGLTKDTTSVIASNITLGQGIALSGTEISVNSGDLSTINVQQGGTGRALLQSGALIVGAGLDEVGLIAPQSNGNFLGIVNGSWQEVSPPSAPTISDGDGINVSAGGVIEVDQYDGLPSEPLRGIMDFVDGKLAVVLGDSGNTAAPGNHTHTEFLLASAVSTVGGNLIGLDTPAGDRFVRVDDQGGVDLRTAAQIRSDIEAIRNLVQEGATGRTILESGGLLVGAGLDPVNLIVPQSNGNFLGVVNGQWQEVSPPSAPTISGGDGINVSAGGVVEVDEWGGFPSAIDRGRMDFVSGRLAVVLGTSGNTAAAGNHTHSEFSTFVTVGGDQDIGGTKAFTGRVSWSSLATTRVIGSFYGGTTNPINTTRLNYDGQFRATQLFEGGTRVALSNGGNATGTWSISISGNAASATTASNVTRSVIAGQGLGGGGQLSGGNVTLNITNPADVTATSESTTTATGHSHALAGDIGRVQSGGSPPSGSPSRPGDIFIVF